MKLAFTIKNGLIDYFILFLLKKIQEFRLGWEDVAASRRSKQGTHYPHYPIAHAFNTYRSHTDETPNMISHWGPAHTRVHLYPFYLGLVFSANVDPFISSTRSTHLYSTRIYTREGYINSIVFFFILDQLAKWNLALAIDKLKHGYVEFLFLECFPVFSSNLKYFVIYDSLSLKYYSAGYAIILG